MPICNVTLKREKPHDRNYPELEDLSLGAALKRRRFDLRLDLGEVAEMLDLLSANYSRFERNIHVPHIRKRKKINKFLGYNFWKGDDDSLADRILQYRIEHHLTVNELGNKIGVSRNTIKRLENGVRISNKMTGVICDFLTIS